MALRTTRSALNSRVSLVTTNAKPTIDSSGDPESPPRRRSTRASARLNLAQYAYSDPNEARRKRAKVEPAAQAEPAAASADEALTDLEGDEPLNEVKAELKGEGGPSTPRKGRATPKSKSGTPKMPMAKREKAHPEPAKWYEQYKLIERMRGGIKAPVDTMGCERPVTMQNLDPKVRSCLP